MATKITVKDENGTALFALLPVRTVFQFDEGGRFFLKIKQDMAANLDGDGSMTCVSEGRSVIPYDAEIILTRRSNSTTC